MNEHHADLCREHDAYYTTRIWRHKVYSDFFIAARLADRGCYKAAYASVPYLSVLGTIYWLWKKYVAGAK